MVGPQHSQRENHTASIYLDHAATTPVDPRVLDAMLPFLTESFGNPSSVHERGREARAALDWARGTIARILGCNPRELIFTSGATEADNLALKGVAFAALLTSGDSTLRPHIVTSAIEHPAVLQTAEELTRFGVDCTFVPVSRRGLVSSDDIQASLRPETCLVSIMYANNEIGTIQSIRAIADVARAAGVPLHVDAVQAAGKLSIDVTELSVSLMSLSAHKINGPKGVGLLYVQDGVTLYPQQHGGGQEYARRAGTENVAGIVGFAAALEIAEQERAENVAHMTALRDRLADGILERVPSASLNGDGLQRLSNNVHISFEDVDGESLLFHLDLNGLAASSGSACASGSGRPSHVLLALGLSELEAEGSLRLTLGPRTSSDEIERAIQIVSEAVERIRDFSNGAGN